ncbi:MAG TPA: M15 family metallopeptidase [Bacillota bacterium]|nr:M15 family metallopeptidase [Bacillota bacterium]
MVELITLLKRSEQRILTLHTALQVRAFELIKRAYKEGYPISVCQALRTIEEQEELYAQGRTAPGNIVTWVRRTYHNFGLAFDYVILTEDGTDCIWEDDNGYTAIGQIGKELGMEWGGDWEPSQRDMPHFQLTFGLSINDLCAGAKPPENVDLPTYENEQETEEVIEMKFDATTVVKCEDKSVGGIILDGVTFVPVRQLAELLGAKVEWVDGEVQVTKV